MKLKSLARWLRAVIIGAALCGALLFGFAVPDFGKSLMADYPEFANRYLPWLLFLEISSLPCWAVLILGWKVVGNIGRGEAFCRENARLLGWVSRLAAADSGYFFLGNMILLLTGMSHPGIALASLGVVLAGIGATVAAAVLSHLVGKACDMRELTDLTI